uniref:C3H1-type domain-containing protein n=1 Tax=Chromera velia CCMP2878 TaxID=1169474 RepID=A0A0G4I6J6_9ALVE|eukprot:Cvel_11435.t1-p1 / transcript=Cvel_11435.t1 / gene=Cvel_11435 / organism=Chromera_velia_CCMP2878 / gene_product=hypothetical protein / transcript_product=hypothetical protein / location=Cvel_scaffold719:31525-36884(-) / protein_length=1308 / sequence_SO=supercontig / SO=protein_coding / is_pseudo=false
MYQGKKKGFSGRFAKSHTVNIFLKTQMCPNVLAGVHCVKDSTCEFAHSQEELREKPDLSKTSLCRQHQSGVCTEGELCRYAHSETELRPAPEHFRFLSKHRIETSEEKRLAAEEAAAGGDPLASAEAQIEEAPPGPGGTTAPAAHASGSEGSPEHQTLGVREGEGGKEKEKGLNGKKEKGGEGPQGRKERCETSLSSGSGSRKSTESRKEKDSPGKGKGKGKDGGAAKTAKEREQERRGQRKEREGEKEGSATASKPSNLFQEKGSEPLASLPTGRKGDGDGDEDCTESREKDKLDKDIGSDQANKTSASSSASSSSSSSSHACTSEKTPAGGGNEGVPGRRTTSPSSPARSKRTTTVGNTPSPTRDRDHPHVHTPKTAVQPPEDKSPSRDLPPPPHRECSGGAPPTNAQPPAAATKSLAVRTTSELKERKRSGGAGDRGAADSTMPTTPARSQSTASSGLQQQKDPPTSTSNANTQQSHAKTLSPPQASPTVSASPSRNASIPNPQGGQQQQKQTGSPPSSGPVPPAAGPAPGDPSLFEVAAALRQVIPHLPAFDAASAAAPLAPPSNRRSPKGDLPGGLTRHTSAGAGTGALPPFGGRGERGRGGRRGQGAHAGPPPRPLHSQQQGEGQPPRGPEAQPQHKHPQAGFVQGPPPIYDFPPPLLPSISAPATSQQQQQQQAGMAPPIPPTTLPLQAALSLQSAAVPLAGHQQQLAFPFPPTQNLNLMGAPVQSPHLGADPRVLLSQQLAAVAAASQAAGGTSAAGQIQLPGAGGGITTVPVTGPDGSTLWIPVPFIGAAAVPPAGTVTAAAAGGEAGGAGSFALGSSGQQQPVQSQRAGDIVTGHAVVSAPLAAAAEGTAASTHSQPQQQDKEGKSGSVPVSVREGEAEPHVVDERDKSVSGGVEGKEREGTPEDSQQQQQHSTEGTGDGVGDGSGDGKEDESVLKSQSGHAVHPPPMQTTPKIPNQHPYPSAFATAQTPSGLLPLSIPGAGTPPFQLQLPLSHPTHATATATAGLHGIPPLPSTTSFPGAFPIFPFAPPLQFPSPAQPYLPASVSVEAQQPKQKQQEESSNKGSPPKDSQAQGQQQKIGGSLSKSVSEGPIVLGLAGGTAEANFTTPPPPPPALPSRPQSAAIGEDPNSSHRPGDTADSPAPRPGRRRPLKIANTGLSLSLSRASSELPLPVHGESARALSRSESGGPIPAAEARERRRTDFDLCLKEDAKGIGGLGGKEKQQEMEGEKGNKGVESVGASCEGMKGGGAPEESGGRKGERTGGDAEGQNDESNLVLQGEGDSQQKEAERGDTEKAAG